MHYESQLLDTTDWRTATCILHIINCTKVLLKFLVLPKLPNHTCRKVSPENHLPGNFLVLKDAFVMKDFESGAVVVNGVRATLIPIGPSLGWPKKKKQGGRLIIITKLLPMQV